MSKPTEHKTVQARILEYAEAIGWTIVSREEAEERRGGIPAPLRKKIGDRNVPAPLSLFFGTSYSLPSCYTGFMNKTTIQAALLADALRRFLESHSARVTESMVMNDVQWGCMATTE